MARIAFLGSPDAAATSLRALHSAGHEIAAVVTEPDRRRGRGGGLVPTPVKQAAVELGLTVAYDVETAVGSGAELAVVVAFGRLVSAEVLERLLVVNLHFSLLPRWRGAAPVERAILAGDEVTGVCLMKVDEGLDTGPVYACEPVAVEPGESAESLRGRLARAGSDLLVGRLREGRRSLGDPVPQEGVPTYAAKLSKAELALDFSREAGHLERLVRAGPAWTTFRGRRLIVHRATVEAGDASRLRPGTLLGGRIATGRGWLVPLEAQLEGRRRQSFSALARGAGLVDGARLEAPT